MSEINKMIWFHLFKKVTGLYFKLKSQINLRTLDMGSNKLNK